MVTVRLERISLTLGNRGVLHDVSAEFVAGELVGVIGPNGAGKSTMVRAMLGLLTPTGGVVELDGKPLSDLSRRDVARAMAYLPQGQTVHWPLTVERLVALGRLPHLAPMSRIAAEDAQAVERAMERADVSGLRWRTVTELSGGERARVMLARALAVGAPALVADEPLAALDPGHQLDVMELLAAEAEAGGLVVAVLHDLTMAARYADRLLLMDQGRIVADGSPRDVLTAERLAEVYGIRASVDFAHGAPVVTALGRAR